MRPTHLAIIGLELGGIRKGFFEEISKRYSIAGHIVSDYFEFLLLLAESCIQFWKLAREMRG